MKSALEVIADLNSVQIKMETVQLSIGAVEKLPNC